MWNIFKEPLESTLPPKGGASWLAEKGTLYKKIIMIKTKERKKDWVPTTYKSLLDAYKYIILRNT